MVSGATAETTKLPLNNNNSNSGGSVSGGDSVTITTTQKRKRRLRTSPMLPPLDISQQTLHHPRSSRKSARVHTVPAMVLSAAAAKASPSRSPNGKRPHSASNNGPIILSPLHHPYSPSVDRRKADRKLRTPERRQINKIETVRILRARPAFYPIKDKPYPSNSKKKEPLELPNNILGKHITLRVDRAGDLKRKRRSPLPPATNLQQQ